MGDTPGIGLRGPVDEGNRPPPQERSQAPSPAQPRAVGSPLPMGTGNAAALTAGIDEPQRGLTPPPPGRGLADPSANEPLEVPSGIQRAVSAFRAALPFVQRILPLLEGNIGAAVSGFLVPQRHHAPPQPPPPPAPQPVNLAPLLTPIQDGLVRLEAQQTQLSDQLVEQNTSLKRVEDQLESVREATDRNTLEQQELMEDLKVVGNKVNLFAFIVLGLLAVSIVLNIVLYMRMKTVFP